MSHNLSILNILVRYIIGIQLVIFAGLLQSVPLIVVSIGLIFTCISGWDPILAIFSSEKGKSTHTETGSVESDDHGKLKQVA